VWSDAVALPFVNRGSELRGRKLAVSFHVVGASGPMTWHAKALQSSYSPCPERAPRATIYPRPHSRLPPPPGISSMRSTWPRQRDWPPSSPSAHSITGRHRFDHQRDDRWPDVLARRLNGRWVVVNAGIGGNQVLGRRNIRRRSPSRRSAALQRLERDVLTLSRRSRAVIWLEGINDFSRNRQRRSRCRDRRHARRRGAHSRRDSGRQVIGATHSLRVWGAPTPRTASICRTRSAGSSNDFVRAGGVFDGVADSTAPRRTRRPAA